jgi:hypothetical protein
LSKNKDQKQIFCTFASFLLTVCVIMTILLLGSELVAQSQFMGTGSPSVLPEGKKIDVLKYAACPSL